MSLTTIVALLIYAIVVCALGDWGWSRLRLPRYDVGAW